MVDHTLEVERQLLRLARHFSALTGRSRRRAGILDHSAYTILSCLNIRGKMTYAQLQQALGLELSTLNRQVRALIRAGYAEKAPGLDGGPSAFRMTIAGREVWQDEHHMTMLAMGKLLAGWGALEVVQFASFLGRFNASVESLTGLAWPIALAEGDSENDA